MDPRSEYLRRLERWSAELSRVDRLHARIAGARLAVAGLAAVLAWLAFISQRISPVWPVVAAVSFAAIVVAHARVIPLIARTRRACEVYRRGLSRLDATWAGTGPDGARFLDAATSGHDLDLFGPGSLFQLIDTARTQAGEATLASWLIYGARIEQVRARQPAIAELTANVQFREDLAVIAGESDVGATDALM